MRHPESDRAPLYAKDICRRPFLPALQAPGIMGVRQHDFRRAFIALHVEAGTHPKLVQERAGHSSIGLPMDLYGKIAGQMALVTEQEARFEALTAWALPPTYAEDATTNSGAHTPTESDGESRMKSDPESIPWQDYYNSIASHSVQGNSQGLRFSRRCRCAP